MANYWETTMVNYCEETMANYCEENLVVQLQETIRLLQNKVVDQDKKIERLNLDLLRKMDVRL